MSRVGNWIGQYSSTVGKGNITLNGIIEGYLPFSSIGNGLVYYSIVDGNNREAGTGVINGNILTRSDVQETVVNGNLIQSSDPLSLSGNSQVFCTFNKQAFLRLASTTGIGEAPVDGNAYGRRNGGWDGVVRSVNGSIGVIALDKSSVGLDQVDNTSDVDKPISTAQQTGLDGKADSVHTHVKADITDFSDGDYATAAQGILADNALQAGENVSLLSNDAGYLTVGTLPASDVVSVNGESGVVVLDKADIGLDQVDNTSDADKPVSTAQQSALDLKLNLTGGTVTGSIVFDDPENLIETGTENELSLASGVGVRVAAPVLSIDGAIGREGSIVTIGENGVLAYTDPPNPITVWQDTDAGPVAISEDTPTDADVVVTPTQDVDYGSVQWGTTFQNLTGQPAQVEIQFYINAVAAGVPVTYAVAAGDTSRLYGSAAVPSTIGNGLDVTYTVESNEAGSITDSFLRVTEAGASTSASWGSITGTLSDQTDLGVALDSKLESGDNVSELTNDAGYLTSAAVDSVNGDTGVVVLDADDIDDTSTTHKFATASQLALADSSVQPADNVSGLTNDAGYLTSISSSYKQTGQYLYCRSTNSVSINGGGSVYVFNTQVATNGTFYSYNTGTGVVTINVTGTYKVTAEISAFNNFQMRFRVGGVDVAGAFARLYTNPGTGNSVTLTAMLSLTATDQLTLFTNATTGDTVSEADFCRLIVERA